MPNMTTQERAALDAARNRIVDAKADVDNLIAVARGVMAANDTRPDIQTAAMAFEADMLTARAALSRGHAQVSGAIMAAYTDGTDFVVQGGGRRR